MVKRHNTILSIAGSDSSAGAGVQADLKTAFALGVYCSTAITAITAQNTLGVNSVCAIASNEVENQIEAVLSDVGAKAVKTGMLFSKEIIEVVAKMIDKYDIKNLVIDPVMVSTSGHKLLKDDAIETLQNILIPKARIITPNIPEAEILLGKSIQTQEDLFTAAQDLCAKLNNKVSVLLKAGHLQGEELIDIFYNAETQETIQLAVKKVDTKNTHGTGCTLSAAIATGLAQDLDLTSAVRQAKNYINSAIIAGKDYFIGSGHGPVHHWGLNS